MLLIGSIEFIIIMASITMPVFAAGMITCFAVEKFKIAGFGTQLPNEIKDIFKITVPIKRAIN